jgi:hypothetical protein
LAIDDGKPIAALATDINLHAIVELVDALKVKSRSSLDGQEAISARVEAFDGAAASAGIKVPVTTYDDGHC